MTIGPFVGYWLVDRPRMARALALTSLLPITALTLVPTSRDVAVACAAEWTLPTFGAVELMANVVLFIPPALLLGVATRRPLVVALGLSAGSAGIEGLQALVTALGRSCSTDDWLTNTIGATIGAAIGALALVAHRTRAHTHAAPHRQEASSGPSPD